MFPACRLSGMLRPEEIAFLFSIDDLGAFFWADHHEKVLSWHEPDPLLCRFVLHVGWM